MIILHDFSMHGTFLVIFQVFNDFQSLWEPYPNQHQWVQKHMISRSGKENITIFQFKKASFVKLTEQGLCLLHKSVESEHQFITSMHVETLSCMFKWFW